MITKEQIEAFEMKLDCNGESINAEISGDGKAIVLGIKDITDGCCEDGETVRVSGKEISDLIANLQQIQAVLFRKGQ